MHEITRTALGHMFAGFGTVQVGTERKELCKDETVR